jgi:hypothetical protein
MTSTVGRPPLLVVVALGMLLCLVAMQCSARGVPSRSELLEAGYVEEASLFHRIFRKDSHQVDLPVCDLVFCRRRSMTFLMHVPHS